MSPPPRDSKNAPAGDNNNNAPPPLAAPRGPPSPEAASPPGGSLRQNRYLTGLQKITKLGKARASISTLAEVSGGAGGGNGGSGSVSRAARRLSDVPEAFEGRRRNTLKKANGGAGGGGGGGNEELGARSSVRRKLAVGVRTAGELIKPAGSGSAPSSPVSPSSRRGEHGRFYSFRRASRLVSSCCIASQMGARRAVLLCWCCWCKCAFADGMFVCPRGFARRSQTLWRRAAALGGRAWRGRGRGRNGEGTAGEVSA